MVAVDDRKILIDDDGELYETLIGVVRDNEFVVPECDAHPVGKLVEQSDQVVDTVVFCTRNNPESEVSGSQFKKHGVDAFDFLGRYGIAHE